MERLTLAFYGNAAGHIGKHTIIIVYEGGTINGLRYPPGSCSMFCLVKGGLLCVEGLLYTKCYQLKED